MTIQTRTAATDVLTTAINLCFLIAVLAVRLSNEVYQLGIAARMHTATPEFRQALNREFEAVGEMVIHWALGCLVIAGFFHDRVIQITSK